MPEESILTPRQMPRTMEHFERTKRGDTYYVLHNPDKKSYLAIDEENYFLWEMMNGEHNLTDLAIAYYQRFGSLPLERLDTLIHQLEANHLIETQKKTVNPDIETGFVPLLTNLADRTYQREFDWNQADKWFSRFYESIGHLFFTKVALFGFLLISVIGIICFIILEPTEEFQLFTFNEIYSYGLIVLLISGWIVLFWHEAGHGLACKFFGRKIHKAGMMFYYGMPTFFVDVSDMWMSDRTPRIMVSLAGPIVNVIIGGIISIFAFVLPPSDYTKALFQAAYVTYLIALLNLNPLLELDGYYCLMDLLEMPQLRQKSFDFLKTQLLPKLRSGTRFNREEIIYSIYSLLSIVVTILIIAFVLYIWENELSLMIHDVFTGQDIMAVILVGGLTVLAGSSLLIGFGARIILYLYRLHDHILKSREPCDPKN
ncbi:MAG: hypothetical protein JXQ82_05795 [Methanomicrobiaceae archaeon]|nr:hypothetical protein [Methanomicrobiaceae archaeon]